MSASPPAAPNGLPPAAPNGLMSRAGGGNARRELGYTVLGCLAGAGTALLASARVWTVELIDRPAPLPPTRIVHSGGELLPWLPALALVALAGAGVLIATRRSGRTVVGLVLVLAGLGLAAGGGYGLVAIADIAAGWPALCIGGGLAVAAAGAFTVARGRSWWSMGTRYERAARRPSTVDGPLSEKDVWDALDRGEDPTDRLG